MEGAGIVRLVSCTVCGVSGFHKKKLDYVRGRSLSTE